MNQLGYFMFGTTGKFIVELSVIGFLMGTCVAFYVVIGDLSPIFFSKIFNIKHFDPNSVRKFLIVLITLTTVVPLSLQRSIESLSFVCKASIGFYVCLTLKIVFESLKIIENYDTVAIKLEYWQPAGIIQCIPIFSMAMSCQLQLFEVYEAMPSNQGSYDSIRKTVNNATCICCIVYSIVGFFGYIAFNSETLSGNVLMNLGPSISNDAITFGFILSIACSFPLVIFPCRSALASFLHRTSLSSEFSSYVPESKYHPITFCIIFSTMILGIMVPSVEVVISLLGSTIGIVICVIFPATCFVKIMKRNSIEKRIAQVMIVLGFLTMILGTYSNLMVIENANSGVHLQSKIIEKLIEHPRDLGRVIQNVSFRSISKNEKDKQLSEDGIKKEELEILAEKKEDLKEVQKELQVKNEEIQELMESKDHLEKKMEIVMQKFEEIAEKVDKIEKKTADGEVSIGKKPQNSMNLNPTQISKLKEIHIEKAKENPSNISDSKVNLTKKSEPLKPLQIPTNDSIKLTNHVNTSTTVPFVKINLNDATKNHLQNQTADKVDSVVKLIKSNEPLSYQIGEKLSQNKLPNKENKDAKPDDEELKNEMRK